LPQRPTASIDPLFAFIYSVDFQVILLSYYFNSHFFIVFCSFIQIFIEAVYIFFTVLNYANLALDSVSSERSIDFEYFPNFN